MKVRQSSLSSADICLRRFQYDLETPRTVYHCGSVRALGTAYHAGLELYYSRGRDPGDVINLKIINEHAVNTFYDELDRAKENWVWDDKVPNLEAAWATLEKMLTTYFREGYQWPDEYEVLGVEETFEFPWRDGHTRGGTIDLILLGPDDYVYGVDHKTAGRMWDQTKHKPRKNNQGPWYVPALRELYPGHAGYRFVFDVMTYAGKFERRVCDPSPEHEQAVESKAVSIVTLYEGLRANGLDLPANPTSNLCSASFCDFWTTCPHGAALDTDA